MMKKLKCLPMATVGLASLVIMLVIIISGHNFEGGVIAAAVGAVLLNVTVISKKIREVTVLLYLAAAFLFSGILMITQSTCSLDAANSVAGRDVEVIATVTGDKESYPAKSVYILKTKTVDGVDVRVRLRLVSNVSLDICPGDEIAFSSKVYSVDKFESSSKIYYMSEGIYLGANVYEGDDEIVITKDGSNTLECKLQLLRDEIKSRIYSLLPNEYGATAIAVLLGDKSGMSDETLSDFRDSGVYHLFAVSGLHLSIWVLGLWNFLKKLGVPKRLNSFIALFFAICFMALMGFTPSVTRAGVMLIVLMTGNLVSRVPHSLNSLGVSLFVILTLNPMAAASISLLLSFSATLGIITVYQHIDKRIDSLLSKIKPVLLKKAVRSLVSVFVISVVAVIFTFPVNCVAFGEVNFIGPVTNLLVSFAATVLMILAGVTVMLSFWPFASNLCALGCGLLSEYVIYISDIMSDVTFTRVRTDGILFSVFIIMAVSLCLCCVILFKNNRSRVKALICCMVSLSIITGCISVVYNHDLTTVKVMDVDDGICLVVKNQNKTAVIGCGGSDAYSFDDIAYEIYDKTPSLLIVPDNNEWNSLFLGDLTKKFSFDRIIAGEPVTTENVTVEPDFILNPWDSGSIEFHKTNELTYAYCVFGQTDILIVFECSDSAVISKHTDADILIFSYYLPDSFDISSFGSVIISSTKQVGEDMVQIYAPFNQNIYSTMGENNITLEMKKDLNIRISYN